MESLDQSTSEIPTTYRAPRAVRVWLVVCMAMVAAMVFIGGLTRLTESGLSMVEWQPLTILPPIGEDAWAAEFAKYQTSPEFIKVNSHMDVHEFKSIFWLEYIHRLLGRSVGLVFFIPWLLFVKSGALTGTMRWRTLGIFALGGLQGVVGWIMVKSGLQDNPWVSPVKLALHLGIACIIFNLLLWEWLSVQPVFPRRSFTFRPLALGRAKTLTALVFIQILLGALVAGADAGLVYNTYPLMNGQIIPNDLLYLRPVWRNFVENHTTIQFAHRTGAHLLVLLIVPFWLWLSQYRKKQYFGKAFAWILGIFILQFGLGVATLLMQVPTLLASLHQMVALALLASFVALCHRLT